MRFCHFYDFRKVHLIHFVDPISAKSDFLSWNTKLNCHKNKLTPALYSQCSPSPLSRSYPAEELEVSAMAAATACTSTALAGQSLLKQSNDLARNVNLGEARVTMRKSASKSAASGSIWWVLTTQRSGSYCLFSPDFITFGWWHFL